MTYSLLIGNKNTSSWSLRPWLALTAAGIPFTEIRVDLRAPDAKAQILRVSPSGKVPALVVDGVVIWDSLAVLEFLAEAHPEARLWPAETMARAWARSVSAEMHAGFAALRQECPMNFTARTPHASLSEACAADVSRIVEIWRACRAANASGGDYLFGAFSMADAMYAPVVSRFVTYVPNLSDFGDTGEAAAYIQTMMAHPAMRSWEAGARAEVAALG